MVENHGLGFGGADSHPSRFTLGCKPLQYTCAEGPGLMKPTGQHHPQKAEMKSCGSQTGLPPAPGPWLLRLEILSIKIMNRTGDKGQPCRSPTCTGNRSDLLPAMRTKLLLRSYRDRTALSKGPRTPYSHGALPTEYHEGHGRMPSPDPQSTCGLVGQTPINPQAPCMESIELVQCSTTGTKTALFLLNPRSEGRLSAEFSSPVPWRRPSRGG
ncbi:hypothetical protein L3Q82_001018 [Scortum barcoo]|uniref:Uncharacterized protein n=1 Tax=Scortum barcoo TaxID=214431 RepID=A0ACB8WAF9_9TELE|nr:hypothetical protein L3Q82_001018 [Scortum barcoo]